ncbi:hypothetical protein [Cardinium endosymbiont of Culicoides punctatus]|uniref:hypothetical protein n=1 Tax=Cardinium endosymbiont of Culicoides punctatus TaxID=2304601 RepID=UPI0014052B92|nr:hypothetical protein [Cardinium endosymbiont of Culicoides punctatus]
MKGNIKPVMQFAAVSLALLSVGMHTGIVVMPIFAGYKFGMILIAFLLLFTSMLF